MCLRFGVPANYLFPDQKMYYIQNPHAEKERVISKDELEKILGMPIDNL